MSIFKWSNGYCMRESHNTSTTNTFQHIYKRNHIILEPFHFESNYMPYVSFIFCCCPEKCVKFHKYRKSSSLSSSEENSLHSLSLAHTQNTQFFVLPFHFISSKLYDMIASRPELTPKLKQKSKRQHYILWLDDFVLFECYHNWAQSQWSAKENSLRFAITLYFLWFFYLFYLYSLN